MSNEAQVGRVILVRHGQSEGNASRMFTRTTEAPLTELGREQARATAMRIREAHRPQRIISSPYTRARQTAEILGNVLCVPVVIDHVWREQSMGQLAGKSYDCVREDPTFNPARVWQWRPPGGESLEDVRLRVGPAFDRLIEDHRAAEIVLVSHAGVMQAIHAHVRGSWAGVVMPGNAEILVVEHTLSSRVVVGHGKDQDGG